MNTGAVDRATPEGMVSGHRFGVPGVCRTAVALTAIVLLALNLRIPTTAVGSLMPVIAADGGRGETFLSLLTAIPLALTLVTAPVVPRIAIRFGQGRVISCALIGIIVGTIIRSIPGGWTLLLGTVLLGVSIACGTVLTPAVIKEIPSSRRALATAMYTMALCLGPALALGLTVPMMTRSGLGWRGTLVLWGIGGVVALLFWWAHLSARFGIRRGSASDQLDDGASADQSVAVSAAGAVVAGPAREGCSDPRPVIADPRVWGLAAYLGITSLTFYTMATWLPTVLVTGGLDSTRAGGLASIVNIVAIPCAFLAPILMRRANGWRLLPVAGLAALTGVGLLLVGGPGTVLIACITLGIGQGLCLGVSYGLVVHHARSPQHAAQISALTSTSGIALAAAGPFLFGVGLELTAGAAIALYGLGLVVLSQVGVGWWLGRILRQPLPQDR